MDLTEIFIEYKNTNKESYLNTFVKLLKEKLFKKFGRNPFFNKTATTFDDVFQDTLIKLILKTDNFDKNKANILTYSNIIFKRTLLDAIKKKDNTHLKIIYPELV